PPRPRGRSLKVVVSAAEVVAATKVVIATAEVVAASKILVGLARADSGEGRHKPAQRLLAAVRAAWVGRRKTCQQDRRPLAALVAPVLVNRHEYDYRREADMALAHHAGVISIQRLRAAAERAAPHVLRSPMVPIEGALLKLECLQPTGSFKVRGFFAAALNLAPERLRRGLITVSAGNAAQACAYTAHRLGVSCRVVMYETAPALKVDGVRRWGATPVLMPRDDLLAWMANEAWTKEPETFLH